MAPIRVLRSHVSRGSMWQYPYRQLEPKMHPTALYKYCAYNQYSLELLLNREAWYAKPASFNDPFDGDFEVSSDFSVKDVLTLLKISESDDIYMSSIDILSDENGQLKEEKRREYLEDMQSMCAVYKRVGVLCLTTSRDNVLMWSHYADFHKGFNIKFEIPQEIPVTKVKYEDTLTPRHMHEIYARSQGDFISIQYSKHTDWQYEDEWRLALNGGDRARAIPGRIVEINFGLRMTEEQKRTIFKIVSTASPDAEFFSARRMPNRIRLEFEPYTPAISWLTCQTDNRNDCGSKIVGKIPNRSETIRGKNRREWTKIFPIDFIGKRVWKRVLEGFSYGLLIRWS